MSSIPASPTGLPWLVADIGGTNARFGRIDDPAVGVQQVHKLPVQAHADLASAVRAYLALLDPALPPPRKAAFAVATGIRGDWIELTNSHWRFSRTALAAELGLQALLVLNDFEALALSLPKLGPAQLRAHGAMPTAQGTLAVVGPGTGLGVGSVVQTAHGWVALPGEGGHITLAAADDDETRLLAAVRTEFPHVSAERLLSGIGLPVLHAAVARLAGQPVPALTAEQIVDGRDSDPLCRQTMAHFCALLGGVAGNLALTVGARGGVFIGGGIVPRLGDAFFASRFRERFEAKGRLRPYLEAIPTALITDTLAALSGAALALEQDRS